MADLNIHRRTQVAFADGLKPIRLVVHVEVLVFVGAVNLPSARRELEVHRFGIGGPVAALPFQDQVAFITPEHIPELRLSDLVSRLAPLEGPIGVFELIDDVHVNRAVP